MGSGDRITDLILRQGEISAEGARRSGELWGGLARGIGNAAGAMVEEHAEKKRLEKMAIRDAELTKAIEGWDGQDPKRLYTDLFRIGGPEVAAKLTPAVASFAKMKGDASKEDEEAAFNVAAALKGGTITEQMWERWSPHIQQKLKPVVSKVFGEPQETAEERALRSERDPMGMEAPPKQQPWSYQQAVEGAEMLLSTRPQEKGDGFTLSPGQQRFGPDGKPIATAAPEAPKPPTPSFQSKDVLLDGKATMVNFDSRTGRYFVGEEDVSSRVRPIPAQGPQSSFQAKEVLNDEGKAVMANFDARTGRYIDTATGKPIKTPRPVPSAEETKDARKFKQAEPILGAVTELSEKINTLQGVVAKMSGGVERAKAQANLNDDVAEYEALVSGFTPLVARALGHTGVLTQQDVDSVKALFPHPGDSKSLRDRKVARIKKIIGDLESGAAPSPSGGGQGGGDPLGIR